jgi:hypothetical protein
MMGPGPVTHGRQPRVERGRHQVVGVADEDRTVAQPRVAGDLLDHLGVVVGRQLRLTRTAVRHRQPADEVDQPCVRRALELGVLVQEVVDVPALVTDHEVVVAVRHDLVEHHEVVHEDLVHPADRLERVQVVLASLALDVRALAGEEPARRVHALAAIGEQPRHGMLGEPVDLQVRVQCAQLVGDGDVAQRVPEPDRRGDEQRSATPPAGGGPAAARLAGPPTTRRTRARAA